VKRTIADARGTSRITKAAGEKSCGFRFGTGCGEAEIQRRLGERMLFQAG
jgi:hypothetical protein